MRKRWWLMAAAVAGWPATALAGMPAPVTLTEMARLRFEVISFFLVVLLVSAGIVRAVWNAMRGAFPKLPRMTYWRALGMMALWGLLFLIILLMISAARELMTPGAWERDGALYRLTPTERAS